jgi:hypothetical protein
MLAAVQGAVQHQAAFPLLLGVQGQAGGDPADHRHLDPPLGRRRFAGGADQVKGPAVAALAFDHPFLLQQLQPLGDGGMADPRSPAAWRRLGALPVRVDDRFSDSRKAVSVPVSVRVSFCLSMSSM